MLLLASRYLKALNAALKLLPAPLLNSSIVAKRNLSLCVAGLLSASLHLLFFWIIIFTPVVTSQPKTIDLILLTEESPVAVNEAAYQARQPQLGSGNPATLTRAARVPFMPLLASRSLQPQSRLVFSRELPTSAASFVDKFVGASELTAATRSQLAVAATAPPGAKPSSDFLTLEHQPLNAKIASVSSYIGQLRSESSAARPRDREPSLAATKALEASYINQWVNKVQALGNLVYPEFAATYQLDGSLQLWAVVSSQGELLELQLMQSSGAPLLDEMARDLVQQAAPFGAFPAQLAARTDRIEISRTWNFIRF